MKKNSDYSNFKKTTPLFDVVGGFIFLVLAVMVNNVDFPIQIAEYKSGIVLLLNGMEQVMSKVGLVIFLLY